MKYAWISRSKVGKILDEVIKKINRLLECPISFTFLESPVIIPSGNTIDESAFNRLIKKADPFNRKLKISDKIVNRFAVDVKEILNFIYTELGNAQSEGN